MKKIFLTLLLTCSLICFSGGAYAVTNIDTRGNITGENDANLDKLNDFNDSGEFIDTVNGGEQGLYNSLIQIARDIKTLFYIIATIFFLVICLRLIFSNNTEEELGKFKKGIIWITVGLIVMQLAFSFVDIAFDRGLSARLGVSLFDGIVVPIIELIRTLASVFFLAMAIYAFYRLVTANGNEEAITNGKMTILYALIGFILVRFAQGVVEAFYGSVSCGNTNTVIGLTDSCVNTQNLSDGINIVVTAINWLNGFVAIVVLIMIIYAGSLILLSAGDEEKIKKGKKTIIYILIGLFILLLNYLILTFFIIPESTI